MKDLVLNIDVKNGEITIIGMVDNPTLVDQVVMQAWLVDGVKKVDNQIRTKGDL
ncbi:BON domain-containing protein [Nitrosomonas nitrosa]|uniref:BON domain-containing protein n=1 Tax=Nitrosomonas nitrosa TaxID=52442 RepID=UPI003C6E7ADF